MFYAQEATDVGHLYRQGSSAKFTCQDMDSIKSYDISWSFRNATFYRILTTNRKLAPDVESAKYKLHSQATILEIVDLTVPDSGNYTCSVTDENGETVLSATAVVIVKGIHCIPVKLSISFFCFVEITMKSKYTTFFRGGGGDRSGCNYTGEKNIPRDVIK